MELIFAKINIIRSSKSVTHTLIFSIKLYHIGVSLMAQMVKNLPAMWENWVQSLGWEDLLEKGMATDSSILTWRIPWTERKSKWSHSVMSHSLRPCGLQPTRLLCPWDFPGKNTGMGSHFLLQGIFQTQGLNSSLLHCRQILYLLRYRVAKSQTQLKWL